MEHLYGYTMQGEEFIFDRKTVTMPHALVIGKAGTGKTQMIQQEIVSNLLTGDENNKIIVVDVNGEYKEFVKTVFLGSLQLCVGHQSRLSW
ncbi:MAG: type IV secretory system conjugative DNA transfer family protein, partial [Ruminococcus sp.]|nr:type IV secretory system conjugative DNA transfer family protein [Ruminococcus sp.]